MDSKTQRVCLRTVVLLAFISGLLYYIDGLPVLELTEGNESFLHSEWIHTLADVHSDDVLATYGTPEEYAGIYVLRVRKQPLTIDAITKRATTAGWTEVERKVDEVCLRRDMDGGEVMETRVGTSKDKIVVGYIAYGKNVLIARFRTRFWIEYDRIRHAHTNS